jgi:hypothetical protein
VLQASRDGVALHDDEGRERLDLEMLEEVGALLLGDAHHLERPVVPAPLQHLREEALDASTMPRQ